MKIDKMHPFIKDVFPEKAQFLSGEPVVIDIHIANPLDKKIKAKVKINVMKLDALIFSEERRIDLNPSETSPCFVTYENLKDEWQGYGVDVALTLEEQVVHTLSTAFDVVSKWNKATRYGFLSDFSVEDNQDSLDIDQLKKYHINAVQFYDWMYKHDDLIPKTDVFIDPLDRELSLTAIKNKINLCHQNGMKALAYGAIYAASRDFYDQHKEWALYDNQGVVQSLGEGWLSIMNIAPESPWTDHIVNEFKKTVDVLDFDGIHMDTYGFPKKAFSLLNGEKQLEDLGEHYPTIINKTRKELESVKEEVALIFNAVGNWSIETVADADQDASYIEVWDPCERYIHLYQIINNAKRIGNKNVILAAYLTSFDKKNDINPEYAENCFMLASSVIFASGGYHLVLGENNGMLCDPYYVNHGIIRETFEGTVRNYYDFIVRYANLLFDMRLKDISMTHANGINDEVVFKNSQFSSYGEPDKVWTMVKEMPGFKVMNLINLCGIESDRWNEAKEYRPSLQEDIYVRAIIDEEIEGVYLASPDRNNCMPIPLEYGFKDTTRGKAVEFTIPQLDVWNLVYIKVKE